MPDRPWQRFLPTFKCTRPRTSNARLDSRAFSPFAAHPSHASHARIPQAFHRVDFKAGETIIRQGDRGDNMEFYVVESGVADISINGKGSVMKATKVTCAVWVACVTRVTCVP